jgi:hypothetical protein
MFQHHTCASRAQYEAFGQNRIELTLHCLGGRAETLYSLGFDAGMTRGLLNLKLACSFHFDARLPLSCSVVVCILSMLEGSSHLPSLYL